MSTCHDTEPSSVPGETRTTKSQVLETGAAIVQDFTPVKQICAHLNAFHVYANDPSRCVEANHYCTHLTEDVRQCLIYASPDCNARLIGVEYMVSPRIFKTLPTEERKLWHTHEFEVKSGMLIMPAPAVMPTAVWEAAETSEMEDVAPIYGKTYHFWQVDRGDVVPMGPPQLMGSFTSHESVKQSCPGGLDELLRERDERFGVDHKAKAKKREGIAEVEKHPAPCKPLHSPKRAHIVPMERLIRSSLKLTPGRVARFALNGTGLFCACALVWENIVTLQLSEGPSMYPTFNTRGDWLLISRMHRNGKGIEVGDVVRFNHPSFLGVHAAKRVIGMPGDFVCRDLPFSTGAGEQPDMIQVPEGHAFVVGDNLPWSRDSRKYGPIPLGLINGKIVARVWPKMEWVRNPMQPAELDD
ncbi:Peptidase S26A signal peptidase I [Penicillium verhagenii]|uniref:Peptidase S26A signal peptidase I n=1 Tax=Penicillium verhagenii TaxID=1562060 RepID=UPI00254574D2|nr:Peptidase S26A signal peptidase I [Penicillium verhagenii]KAJ5939062.1 Peptidase S26A signal peptidase I [Penicillium verhagenii]